VFLLFRFYHGFYWLILYMYDLSTCTCNMYMYMS
jgi:hypothetical protein